MLWVGIVYDVVGKNVREFVVELVRVDDVFWWDKFFCLRELVVIVWVIFW